MKKLCVVIIFLSICALITGCSSTAAFEVSGTTEQTRAITDPNPKTEGGKITSKVTAYFDVHGTFEGTKVNEGTIVVDMASGRISSDVISTFTGKVRGKSGSLVSRYIVAGQFSDRTGQTGVSSTEGTIIGGTGDLANLRGTLHFEGKFDKDGATSKYLGRCFTAGACTWQEATKHIGETATVTGPIINSVEGPYIVLGIGKGASEAGSFLVRLEVDRAKIPADRYKDKTISVTGPIGWNAAGGARIWVTDLSQIVEK